MSHERTELVNTIYTGHVHGEYTRYPEPNERIIHNLSLTTGAWLRCGGGGDLYDNYPIEPPPPTSEPSACVIDRLSICHPQDATI